MGGGLSLRCVVVGEGRPFTVKIDSNEKVDKLVKKIKEEHKNTILRDAKELKLYCVDGLVQKSPTQFDLKGTEIDDLSVKLLGDFDGATTEMVAIYPLSEYPQLKDSSTGRIHVFVLPEGPVVSETSAPTQMVQRKRKRYQHSKMDPTNGMNLLRALHIHVEVAEALPFATRDPTPVQPFKWTSVDEERGLEMKLTEEQQRQRYQSYLEDNIGPVLAEKELCVLGVEKDNDILSVAVPGFKIDLVGRTDILVLSDIVKTQPDILQFLPGVRLLIEVKKKGASDSVYQALSELIALDFLTRDPVMALLTDLNGHWKFLWVSEKRNNSIRIEACIIKTPSEAFEVIRTLLAQSPTSHEDIQLPCCEGPVKRRKLTNMLPSFNEGGEGNDILERIQRMRDVASELGPDIEMVREIARQFTGFFIPCFSVRKDHAGKVLPDEDEI
ncbi:hypothetical protein Ae201684P_021506 [Aphanomyces euteiches]|uniref:Crinkler effector protein N-terminal domain-containing protein n=1 Tax=Aphanomyces euteiches TaxID=100861 RepID=A0A6G0X7B0_9STRA|nr:hypothetical protein Ae201684_007889 [Aphanomyces euteiches]KAH9067347.1 hypothetical protein Ae201684P_021506 [Aphanomyces euteiches]KAH9133081.1 hypothetical protein AeRB84_020766 [Aphanomyces euteiches]